MQLLTHHLAKHKFKTPQHLTRFVKSIFLTHFIAISHQLTDLFACGHKKGWRNQWLINWMARLRDSGSKSSFLQPSPWIQGSGLCSSSNLRSRIPTQILFWTLPFLKQKHKFLSGNVSYTALTRLFLRFWTVIPSYLYIDLVCRHHDMSTSFTLAVPKQGTFHAILPNVPGAKTADQQFCWSRKESCEEVPWNSFNKKNMNKSDDFWQFVWSRIYNQMPKSQKWTVTTSHLHVLRPRLFTVDHRLHALGGGPRTQRIWACSWNKCKANRKRAKCGLVDFLTCITCIWSPRTLVANDTLFTCFLLFHSIDPCNLSRVKRPASKTLESDRSPQTCFLFWSTCWVYFCYFRPQFLPRYFAQRVGFLTCMMTLRCEQTHRIFRMAILWTSSSQKLCDKTFVGCLKQNLGFHGTTSKTLSHIGAISVCATGHRTS